jgi:hypothetical protein
LVMIVVVVFATRKSMLGDDSDGSICNPEVVV